MYELVNYIFYLRIATPACHLLKRMYWQLKWAQSEVQGELIFHTRQYMNGKAKN